MRRVLAVLLALAAAPLLPRAAAANRGAPTLATLEDLLVTEGSLEKTPEGFLATSAPRMRAWVRRGRPQTARLRFRYRDAPPADASETPAPVARSVSLGLRRRDVCNGLRFAWHVDPGEYVEVWLERGELRPDGGCSGELTRRLSPPIQPPGSATDGLTHELRGDLFRRADRYEIRLHVDGHERWRGGVSRRLLDPIDGAASLRSEGPGLVFKLFTAD